MENNITAGCFHAMTLNECDFDSLLLHQRAITKIAINFEAWSFIIQINLLDKQSEVETPEQQRIVDRWDIAFSLGLDELSKLALQTQDAELGDNGSAIRALSPIAELGLEDS